MIARSKRPAATNRPTALSPARPEHEVVDRRVVAAQPLFLISLWQLQGACKPLRAGDRRLIGPDHGPNGVAFRSFQPRFQSERKVSPLRCTTRKWRLLPPAGAP
jgi:hypothetical protein